VDAILSKDGNDAGTIAGRWEIGAWSVEPAVNEIRRGGETLRIEPKAMEVLVFLAVRAGQVVSRDALLSALWPGAVVGDDALSQAVIKLRKALGDPAKSPQYIETIPKRGYRLVATAKHETDTRKPAERSAQPEAGVPTPAQATARSPRRTAAVAVTLALLIAVAIVLLATRYEQELPTAEVPSVDDLIADRSGALPTIAVMPFETQIDDAEQAYLARGIAADLTTDMSAISGLRVINVSTLGGRDVPPSGATSPARYLVSGSVHRASEALKVNVRLVDTRSGQMLWAQRYERPLRDLVALEEQIVSELVSVLPVQISKSEKRQLARRYTRNPEAYDYFLRGKAAFLTRLQADNDTAKAMYRKALELDPTFARAYAGLALTHTADYRNQWTADGPGAMARAFELANTALQIDPNIPEVYVVLGYVYAVRREYAQAIKYLHKAIALDRSYADAYAYLGAVYTHIGQPDRTVGLLRTAMRLNADAGFIYFLVLGRAYFFQGDTEQAAINLREALARNPADLETRIYTAANLVAAGNLKEARWEAEEIRHLQQGFATDIWLQTSPTTDADMKQKLMGLLAKVGL
jgi:DNA-binding winged helix-turn-helix (wHTH) protein/TolB-like protein/Flp pilus assembly protein TadD